MRTRQNDNVIMSRQIRWDKETAFLVGMVPTRRAIPKIRPMLAMFEPIIFPRINPGELLLRAEIEVKSSGVEVAIETMVNPTTTGGTPRLNATFEL